MRKVIFVMLVLGILLSFNTYVLGASVFEIRTKFFEESKELKSSLAKSKDVVLVNTMWDACIMTTTQLDAYFCMIGVFETIEKEDLNQEAVDYLINWVKVMKQTNNLNMQSLKDLSQPLEATTVLHIKKMMTYFEEFDNILNAESAKMTILRKSAKAE